MGGLAIPRPKRRALGQHWLVDRRYLWRIAEAARPDPQDTVIEVGAGPGNLTRYLLPHCARLVAVEVDQELAHRLQGRFGEASHLWVVRADILQVAPGELLALAGAGPPYVVVGNLPFSIGTAVVRHFLRASPPPRWLVVTLQLEVAQNVVARPGDMTLLSVEMQLLAEPRLLFIIPPRAFRPRPKVYSAVMRLDVRPGPAVAVDDMEAFLRVAQAGFAAPRKQMRNSLALGLKVPTQMVEEMLRAADIDPARRPGELTLEEWARLYQVVRGRGLVGHE